MLPVTKCKIMAPLAVTQVSIRGAASNATIVGESTKICEREVLHSRP